MFRVSSEFRKIPFHLYESHDVIQNNRGDLSQSRRISNVNPHEF